jgi:hypothetical protein
MLQTSAVGAAAVVAGMASPARAGQNGRLRLGGPVFEKYQDPDA